jgi:flagellar biogenesis protein FliO
MPPIASILATLIFCGGMIGVAIVLGRYRDRLQRSFGGGAIAVRSMTQLGDGARLCVVEVEGTKLVCGLGRGGVTTIFRLDDAPKPPVFSLSPTPSDTGGA